MNDETEIILKRHEEEWTHARHSEDQRATVTNLVITLASAGIAFIAQTGLNPTKAACKNKLYKFDLVWVAKYSFHMKIVQVMFTQFLSFQLLSYSLFLGSMELLHRRSYLNDPVTILLEQDFYANA